MVASISARGGAKSALSYYSHLGRDDYYAQGGEPPGRWAGDAAERLSLKGPVTKAEFEAALSGRDPKTGAELVKAGGRIREHAAGWDMTFSAPKSVSVLWALSPERERGAIEAAHRSAVAAGTKHLEATAAWARRGKGGAIREQTAGLLIAKFDHYTSRDLDPQLHTHAFIFNLAPRQDGSWGAIVSRDLYKAQKQAGAAYRNALARELESLGVALEREPARFRVAAIPRSIERAFSKRRQAIEEAARTYGYRTPKGMELATLRTRRAKSEAKLETLHVRWRLEARALGFDLKRDGPRHASEAMNRIATSQLRGSHFERSSTPGAAASAVHAARATLAQAGHAVSGLMRAAEQASAMPGVAVDLRTGAPPAPPRDRRMRKPEHRRGRHEHERE